MTKGLKIENENRHIFDTVQQAQASRGSMPAASDQSELKSIDRSYATQISTFKYSDGSHWEESVPEGRTRIGSSNAQNPGIRKFTDGSKWEGKIDPEGNPREEGTLTFANGAKWKGELDKNWLPTGRGTFIDPPKGLWQKYGFGKPNEHLIIDFKLPEVGKGKSGGRELKFGNETRVYDSEGKLVSRQVTFTGNELYTEDAAGKTLKYANGLVWKGNVDEKGKPKGDGSFIYQRPDREFSETFVNGKRTGYGSITYKDGNVYNGQINAAGEPHGMGSMADAKKGDLGNVKPWVNDQEQGPHRVQGPEGTIFFKNGVLIKEGLILIPRTGLFSRFRSPEIIKMNTSEQTGVKTIDLTKENGQRIIEQINKENGKLISRDIVDSNGYGTSTDSSGNVRRIYLKTVGGTTIREDVENGQQMGRGTVTRGDDTYTGPIDEQGRPNGQGVSRSSNGEAYSGTWVDGVRRGVAKYTTGGQEYLLENGSVWTGQLDKHGHFDNAGTLTTREGQVFKVTVSTDAQKGIKTVQHFNEKTGWEIEKFDVNKGNLVSVIHSNRDGVGFEMRVGPDGKLVKTAELSWDAKIGARIFKDVDRKGNPAGRGTVHFPIIKGGKVLSDLGGLTAGQLTAAENVQRDVAYSYVGELNDAGMPYGEGFILDHSDDSRTYVKSAQGVIVDGRIVPDGVSKMILAHMVELFRMAAIGNTMVDQLNDWLEKNESDVKKLQEENQDGKTALQLAKEAKNKKLAARIEELTKVAVAQQKTFVQRNGDDQIGTTAFSSDSLHRSILAMPATGSSSPGGILKRNNSEGGVSDLDLPDSDDER